MRAPATLLVGLLALAVLPAPATAAGCDNPPIPWQTFHCDARVADTLDVQVHYHPEDSYEFNDYAEACFIHGDPTGGLIGDCRGILLPTLP